MLKAVTEQEVNSQHDRQKKENKFARVKEHYKPLKYGIFLVWQGGAVQLPGLWREIIPSSGGKGRGKVDCGSNSA
ncbi:hypothetical protein [Ketobacter sp.]|uniref:hypothetical protein n=1 Tax=Ketobacter sp. TaxID=2083498 RepID=UPI0025C105BA|nr:hypothetical protein [Ketobacter sp.]